MRTPACISINVRKVSIPLISGLHADYPDEKNYSYQWVGICDLEMLAFIESYVVN